MISDPLIVHFNQPPMPSPRPRFARMGKFTKTYMPKEYMKYKEDLACVIMDAVIAHGEWTYDEDDRYIVEAMFVCKRPKDHTSKRGGYKPGRELLMPAGKKDIDNYLKSLLDAIGSAMNVWSDDDRVVHSHITKVYEMPAYPVGTIARITKLDPSWITKLYHLPPTK